MSRMRVFAHSVECLDSNGLPVESGGGGSNTGDVFRTDPGSISRQASAYLSSFVLKDPGATCVVTLRIVRQRDGFLDPAFGEGGSISANRYDIVQFNVIP